MINALVRARDYYFSQPRLQFEAMTLGLAVLFGLLFMPALIYLAGRYTLQPYVNGGLFALYSDFYAGFFALRPSAWIVVFGPFLFLSLARGFHLILRKI